MKKAILHSLISILAFSFTGPFATSPQDNKLKKGISDGEYTMVIEGYDWGPAVSKVILSMGTPVPSINLKEYSVQAERISDCLDPASGNASGKRDIVYAYVSDSKGNKVANGTYVTLVLTVGPDLAIGAPMQYFYSNNCRGTQWVDYKMSISHNASNKVWNKEAGRISPVIDKFDLSGSYTHDDKLTMSYASFAPENGDKKSPLIIWLHGGGEGGTDPTIPLLANRASNYASDEIQSLFGGAYVLVPQCPGAWMHNKEGVSTWGREDDVYNVGLMALIRHYVAANPNIDTDRIYVGGCSNGGYMSLKLMFLHPDYFAAAFISALAYQSEYITDGQINSISDKPIWFIHAADDQVTIPDQTVIPVYKRLIAAGAKNVHFSYYDHVVDITGFFGGENYHYNGHLSWIYSHANKCTTDFDGNPVTMDGKPVTIMEWMAAKTR